MPWKVWVRTGLKSVDDNAIQTGPAEGGNNKTEGSCVQRIQEKMNLNNSANDGHLSWNQGLPRNA